MRVYRASSLGYSLEALVAGHLGYEGVDPPEFLQKAFDEGTALEPVVLSTLRDRGWFIQDEQLEVEFEVIPGVAKVVGHLDGTGHPDSLPWGVVEVKTMADKSWKDFALHGWASNNPLITKYKWQASAYELATGKPHYMVAWNKATEEIYVEFSQTPFFTIADIALKLQQCEDFIAAGMVPDGCTDFPCPYYYLHPPRDEVAKVEDDELESLMEAWLKLDKDEKAAKTAKDIYRGKILALAGDAVADKVKGECGVTVETYWQEASEYVTKRKEGWITRISGPRGKGGK